MISHLPESSAIGTGEIVDAYSRPGQRRNQFDIVIYRKNFSKLNFGGDINGFLVESVIATIEVKSKITESELQSAINASRNAKRLQPNLLGGLGCGYIPPRVLNYVVAYDGPAQMSTVYHWIPAIYSKLGISQPNLPLGAERTKTPSQSVDGIFVLKKGFVYFDNVPLGFASDSLRSARSPTVAVDQP